MLAPTSPAKSGGAALTDQTLQSWCCARHAANTWGATGRQHIPPIHPCHPAPSLFELCKCGQGGTVWGWQHTGPDMGAVQEEARLLSGGGHTSKLDLAHLHPLLEYALLRLQCCTLLKGVFCTLKLFQVEQSPPAGPSTLKPGFR